METQNPTYLIWWNKLPYLKRKELYKEYFGCDIDNGQWNDEVEEIWRRENDLPPKGSVLNDVTNVDFDMLKSTIERLTEVSYNTEVSLEEHNNLLNFVDYLSTSNDFSHINKTQ